ncbi:hypothetical protein LZ480_13785 [Solibacillus sp. MA9]|uniref:Uncharacterized protein n=1 Tax=Solibacillus palustris TaxID=2908203 RepID=A0ABS9UF16_9BACL|nr:hypothetical protein [Solibacillus sp. MA9]MCH7322946.1 hypothetical protein [Solibacillus sp. MA9]
MAHQINWLFVLQLGMALFWIMTYILIIMQGFRDRAYGMPMVAICANISWEFIFAFIYPINDIQRKITMIWFALDIVILMQYLTYGRKEFKKYLSGKLFYSSFFITLGISFCIILMITHEINDFEGKYVAFSQNLMMSGLFISLLLWRGNLKGQSLAIAIFKMLGTLCISIASYMYFKASLITMISVAILIYDWIYIGLVYKLIRKNSSHINLRTS